MINVFKIGGNVVDNPSALKAFLSDFARVEGPKVLVHGGGKEATRLSAQMGLETTMVNGRRVTDAATLDVCTMVYAGLVNKRVVAGLQRLGVNAIGLCGADGALIISRRRDPKPVDYGFVGDVRSVNTDTLGSLIAAGLVPVVCAITLGEDGQLLNTNADSVACAVASAAATVDAARLTFCFEKPGVMLDVDDPDSVIPEISTQSFEDLKGRGVVHSGMLPKIENALAACRAGVESVTITSAENFLQSCGTVIRL